MKQDKLTTKQALEYLQSLHPDAFVTLDAFYHRLYKGKGIPHHVTENKRGKRLYFSKHDLNAVWFRKSSRKPVMVKKYGEPILVTSEKDVEALHKKYGEIVTIEGFQQALLDKYQQVYSREAIKQRLRRKTLVYVGYSGTGNSKVYWIPLEQLEWLHFLPTRRRTS